MTVNTARPLVVVVSRLGRQVFDDLDEAREYARAILHRHETSAWIRDEDGNLIGSYETAADR